MRLSSRTHPLETVYRETYKQIVSFRNGNLSSQERVDKLHQHQLDIKQLENDVHKEIAQWTEHTDEQGNRFYFNREERQSTWTDPRPAKCQILYLRMKMLRILQSNVGGAFHGLGDNARFAGGQQMLSGMGGSDDDNQGLVASKRQKVAGPIGGHQELDDPSRRSPAQETPSNSESDDEKESKK